MKSLGLCVALIAIFASTSMAAKGLLGAEKCTWGPSYWCSGLKPSRDCNKVTSLCIKKVWNKNPYPEDNDDVCTICKNMVKQARDQLESNETQTELMEVFEGSCALIPIRIIADECKTLADEFVPELVETLASEMNPDTVCSVAGLCNSKRIDKLLEKLKHETASRRFTTMAAAEPTECDICKQEAKKLSDKIYQADKDVVVDKVLDVCGFAGSFADACRIMVLENFDDIYDILIHLDDGVCDLAGMCPEVTSRKQISTTMKTNPEDLQCEFCEKVIKHWIDTWTANTTQDEFKEVLEAFCHKMKADRVDHCLHIVDDYYIPWFNYILHELNPSTACTLMGLCGTQFSATLPVIMEPPSKAYANPKIAFTGDDEAFTLTRETQLVGGYFAPQTAVLLDKPGCTICEFTINALRKIIGTSKNEEEIGEALAKVCTMLPSAVRSQCDNLVDTYGAAIIEIISRDVDPQEVCTMMQLCGHQESLLSSLPADNPIVAIKVQDDNCALCQFAMQTVYTILDNKDNEEEIKNALETLCRYMPASIEDQCEKYVESYSELIIQFILKNMTPEQICTELGLCKQCAKSEITLTKDQSECVMCELVVNSIETFVTNTTSEAEVRQALEKVCKKFKFESSCTAFVDKYADIIVDFLTHQMAPHELCERMGLCKEDFAEQFQMLAEVDDLAQEAENVEGPRPYCTLCEYAIGEVDKMITDKQNEEEIKSVLDRICYELSAPIQKECLNMVTRYTDEIIQMFVADYTPQEVCAKLGLCDKPALKPESNAIPIVANIEPTSSPLCVLCEFAMSILEKQILTNRTLDMVERAVEMVCAYMPKSVSDQCIDFVQQYGDQIIDLIINAEMNPDQVCAGLSLCSSIKTWDASPVGGQKCNFGPAFWCQSKIHAKACGTMRYCEENVWGTN